MACSVEYEYHNNEGDIMDIQALIILAEMLDKARRQANAIDDPEISSQRGVYGTIVLALGRTLEQIIGSGYEATRYATSDRVYESIVDGNTVRQALEAEGITV